REHAVVADDAIVRDVGIGQQPVAVADPGAAAAFSGAPVQGDEFADGVLLPDDQFDAFAPVLLVLRVAAHGDVADEAVARADPGRARHRAVRTAHRPFATLHAPAARAEWPRARPVARPRARLDDRRRADQGLAHAGAATSAQRMSAHAACSPSSRALPWYSAMLRMVRLRVTSRSSRSPGTTMRENFAPSIFTR